MGILHRRLYAVSYASLGSVEIYVSICAPSTECVSKTMHGKLVGVASVFKYAVHRHVAKRLTFDIAKKIVVVWVYLAFKR